MHECKTVTLRTRPLKGTGNDTGRPHKNLQCIGLDALSGVRISWLMLARKADLSRSEVSAFSLATSSSRFICSISVKRPAYVCVGD